jgi:hypothetical protein
MHVVSSSKFLEYKELDYRFCGPFSDGSWVVDGEEKYIIRPNGKEVTRDDVTRWIRSLYGRSFGDLRSSTAKICTVKFDEQHRPIFYVDHNRYYIAIAENSFSVVENGKNVFTLPLTHLTEFDIFSRIASHNNVILIVKDNAIDAIQHLSKLVKEKDYVFLERLKRDSYFCRI